MKKISDNKKNQFNPDDFKESIKCEKVYILSPIMNDYRKIGSLPEIKDDFYNKKDIFDINPKDPPIPPAAGGQTPLPKKLIFSPSLIVGERSLERRGIELEEPQI